MTIEIRELVIEARVTPAPSTAPANGAMTPLDEQDRLVELIVRRVLEQLRQQRGAE